MKLTADQKTSVLKTMWICTAVSAFVIGYGAIAIAFFAFVATAMIIDSD